MFEGSIILLVLLVAVSLLVGARLRARNRRQDVAAETARLHKSLAWYEERLRLAKQKHWNYELIRKITEQLEDTRFQLAQINSRPGK